MNHQATYSPEIFNVATIEQAKGIILTPQAGMSPEQRWQTETPYLLSMIENAIPIDDSSIILDYGCGIGRMAKALIDKHNCRVVGVDISPSMRALSAAYVSSNRFFACDPASMYWLGVRFDAALAIWTLQHCYQVKEDISRISQSLIWKGKLFVVNDHRRIVE
jgi:SAM-dependent methyltransferase